MTAVQPYWVRTCSRAAWARISPSTKTSGLPQIVWTRGLAGALDLRPQYQLCQLTNADPADAACRFHHRIEHAAIAGGGPRLPGAKPHRPGQHWGAPPEFPPLSHPPHTH